MISLHRILLSALGVCAIAAADEQVPLNLDDYTCTHPPYQVLMVSKSPLVLYLPSFITPSERAHLLRVRSVSPLPT
jgi:prolyl 4-hydroxylase